jgi:hypothetical protein
MPKSVQINVDSSAMSVHTQNMRNINRTALPVAIRNTLNDAAFYDKKTAFPNSAQESFSKIKNKTFFKKFSGVEKARGYNINQMHSSMGMTDLGTRSARDAVENMSIQERGGVVNDGFAYLSAARGGRENGKVRKANYYDRSKVISGRSKAGRNKGTNKSKFIARAFKAKKEKKPMFFNSMKGNFLVSVKSIKRDGRTKVKIDFKLLMKERSHKPSKIKATHFAEKAGQNASKKIVDFYNIQAERQIKRAIK